YASRGTKKFGDKCESTLECGFPGSICDPKKKSCQCVENLPITNHIDKCGKEAAINDSCFFNEQCEAFSFQTVCRDGRCICRFDLSPIVNKDGRIECYAKQESREPERYIDPAMIGILAGMALMFIIICVVLRLFSRARWHENRTIFNTPNPRLMNVSLLRDNKLLHGQERRGSRMSVRMPSRQPSMASLRAHSPNPSLGSRRGSRGSSNMSAASTRSNRSNPTNGQDSKLSNELWSTLDKNQPILAAHRGEKVLMPEHTLGAYELAAIEGADYVEPDLVFTEDGVLVCFHDLSLRTGTNVADLPQFSNKMTNFTYDIGAGINQTISNDWFIHNFTLAELKQIRVTQLVRGVRPQFFNDLFEIPTFVEYLEVIHKMSYLQNRSIGVIPELKSPKFHNSLWPASPNHMENSVLSTLKDYGYAIKQGDVSRCNYTTNGNVFDIECGHVIIQSFELDCIKYLHSQTTIDLLKLVSTPNYEELTYEGLKEVAGVAQHFHVGKEFLYRGVETILQNNNYWHLIDQERIASLGGFIPFEKIIEETHALNVKVGVYTIVDSHEYSDPNGKEREMLHFFEMGVDGFFVENVPEAVLLRMKFDYQLQLKNVSSSASSLGACFWTIMTLMLIFSWN
ncbi:Glycerophosphodiester phosphodiesterase GDPD5, partial [Pseudolycoriella hygida]